MGPPKPPLLAVTTEVGSQAVSLAWNPPEATAQELQDIRGYRVYRDGACVYDGDRSLGWRDNGPLKGSKVYQYAVATVNHQNAESAERACVTATTNTPGKPGPPTWLKVTKTSQEFISLSWAPPQDLGGASVTCYNVWRNGAYITTVVGRDVDTGKDRD